MRTLNEDIKQSGLILHACLDRFCVNTEGLSNKHYTFSGFMRHNNDTDDKQMEVTGTGINDKMYN